MEFRHSAREARSGPEIGWTSVLEVAMSWGPWSDRRGLATNRRRSWVNWKAPNMLVGSGIIAFALVLVAVWMVASDRLFPGFLFIPGLFGVLGIATMHGLNER